ncbi:helix-turn-helix domain-containing protein [Paenibacillus rhizoplanae]
MHVSLRRAQILLWADENRVGGKLSDIAIAEQLHIHTNTVYLVRKTFAKKRDYSLLLNENRD